MNQPALRAGVQIIIKEKFVGAGGGRPMAGTALWEC